MPLAIRLKSDSVYYDSPFLKESKDSYIKECNDAHLFGLEKIKFDKHMNKVSIPTVVNFVNKGGESPHPMVTEWKSIRTKGLRWLRQTSEKGSNSEVSPVQRTEALLRGLSLVLEHHDAKEKVVIELKLQVHKYLDNSSTEMVWLKRCKYLLCYPLARYLRNVLPDEPDKAFKPSGALRGWMKARLCVFNFKNTHLWYSWFQSKRSTLPLSDDVVADAYIKHKKTLTKPDPVSFENDPSGYNQHILNEIFEDPIFKQIIDGIRQKIFKNYDKLFKNRLKEQPKTSACDERSRKDGGQVEQLRNIVGLTLPEYEKVVDSTPPEAFDDISLLGKKVITLDNPCLPELDQLFRMDYFPRIFTRKGEKRNYTSSVYEAYGREEWKTLKDHVKEFRETICPKYIPESRASRSLDNLNLWVENNKSFSPWAEPKVEAEAEELRHQQFKNQQLVEKNLECTIQAVLEPNKIRIISKGEALPYYNCKTLQKVLHKHLKKMPCFRLIGRPLIESDISDIAKNATTEDIWSSVDYSAATDGLSYSFSNRIFSSIVSNLPLEDRDIAISVLGPHRLKYPSGLGLSGDTEESKAVMRNGQLMGSILSFPILCLANLGLYLLASREEREKRGWSYKETINSVLINGDDMVYALPAKVYENNTRFGECIGLEMSVGKAYQHHEYLNINSQSLLCNLRKEVRVVRPVNYLNTGLFFGLHKVQGKIEGGLADQHTKQKEGIVANLNCLLSGALPGKKEGLLKLSLTTHKETIRQECLTKTFKGDEHVRNLFIKEVLGGMGVSPPEGHKFKVKKQDLYVASGFIARYPDLKYTLEYPIPGPSPIQLETYEVQPWAARSDISNDKPRIPFIRNTFADLRKTVRSRSFAFYIPNKNHRICALPNDLSPSNRARLEKDSQHRTFVDERCASCCSEMISLPNKKLAQEGFSDLLCLNSQCNPFIGPLDHSGRLEVQAYQNQMIEYARLYDLDPKNKERDDRERQERKDKRKKEKKEKWAATKHTLNKQQKIEFWSFRAGA